MRTMAEDTQIPMDPEDLTQIPPEDLDDCGRCGGGGEIVTGTDPVTGKWVTEECPSCRGTGTWWWAA